MDIYLIAKILGAIAGAVGSLTLLWTKILNPLISFFAGLYSQWNSIVAELSPNGGTSIKDAIGRIETRQLVQEQRTKALDNDAKFGIWECDEYGRCIYVNRTYQRITGMQKEDLLGFGWINAIYLDDRQTMLSNWELTLKHQREFYGEFRVEQSDGKLIQVVSIGHPIADRDGKFKGYVGQLVEKKDEDNVFFSIRT